MGGQDLASAGHRPKALNRNVNKNGAQPGFALRQSRHEKR
jgi:hypothetical protein